MLRIIKLKSGQFQISQALLVKAMDFQTVNRSSIPTLVCRSQLQVPLVDHLSSSVPDEGVPSNVYLHALFCLLVARPRLHCTFYLQNGTSARVWRCHVTYDQHPRTNHTTEFPLYSSPHLITFSRAPPWPSPPTSCGLVLPANHYMVASPT